MEVTKWLNKKIIKHVLLIFVVLIQLFFSMEFFEGANEIKYFTNFEYIFVTFIIWISEYLFIKGITNKTKISLSIVVGLELLFDICNYFVRTIRGSAITISDLYAIKTGLSVAKNVSLTFDIRFVIAILITISIIIVISIFRKNFIENKSNWIARIIKMLIIFIVIGVLSKTNIYNKFSIWDINENYRDQGSPITILKMLYNFKVKAPDGYDKNEVESILNNYESSEEVVTEDMPNIIVIINESFCDYYNLYKSGNADSIEYFTEISKSENVVSGILYSSEFGGQTSNVEYEFLTQNSTRILPMGSYVFQQYITKPIKSSLVENLKSQGYKISAIHPWENYAYSRNKIYPLFGFETMKFKNDIESLEKNFNNDFFSDRTTYKELMKEVNGKDKGEKVFEYVLTVQNHTGFLNPDPNQMTYSDDLHENVYMQLIHESAEALREVVDELKQKDEKYILLFFGDHQPNLDDSDNSIERSIEQYEVPFLIWANYDIEEKYNVKTSMIFLQNYLLESAGVRLSKMNNYMNELQKYYPIITKRFYMDIEGNLYKSSDTSVEIPEQIIEYDKIDYYRIFDDK